MKSNNNMEWLTIIKELAQDQVLLGITMEDKLDGTDHLLHLSIPQPKKAQLSSTVFFNPAALHSENKAQNGKISKLATRCMTTIMI